MYKLNADVQVHLVFSLFLPSHIIKVCSYICIDLRRCKELQLSESMYIAMKWMHEHSGKILSYIRSGFSCGFLPIFKANQMEPSVH